MLKTKIPTIEQPVVDYTTDFTANDYGGMGDTSYQAPIATSANTSFVNNSGANTVMPDYSKAAVATTQTKPVTNTAFDMSKGGLVQEANGKWSLGGQTFDNIKDAETAMKIKQINSAGETSFGEYAGGIASGLGALTGVASYFDNKEMNKKRMDAMDTNIGIARAEQAHRADFRNSTKSAFA